MRLIAKTGRKKKNRGLYFLLTEKIAAAQRRFTAATAWLCRPRHQSGQSEGRSVLSDFPAAIRDGERPARSRKAGVSRLVLHHDQRATDDIGDFQRGSVDRALEERS